MPSLVSEERDVENTVLRTRLLLESFCPTSHARCIYAVQLEAILFWEHSRVSKYVYLEVDTTNSSGTFSLVFEKSKFFGRGLAFSALSYLAYKTYILISQSVVVHADVQGEDQKAIPHAVNMLKFLSATIVETYQLIIRLLHCFKKLLWFLDTGKINHTACLTSSIFLEEPSQYSVAFPMWHYKFLKRVDELLDQADYLYGSGETEKLWQLLNQHKNRRKAIDEIRKQIFIAFKSSLSKNAQVLWRLARASRDLAHLSHTSAEKKKQLTYEALEYAKAALEKDSSCFSVHKWYAICISDVGDYEGIKTKIANAFVIKEHFQKAIELNPKDATSLHLMGIWCYTFAEMPWYQSKIAAILFSTPPSSTYEEALRYFQKAEDGKFYKGDAKIYDSSLLYLMGCYSGGHPNIARETGYP
ncbi:Regulator of microtubule dynamics protein 1 [Varanus komodoensis]|nr:Regulator of microtubule dynamics protein 1 [Varanus komodoensis]